MIKPARYFLLVLFAVFPHLGVFPLDIVAIVSGLFVWTGVYCFKNVLKPSVWMLRAITIAVVAYCYLRFGSLANPDAATAVLAMITVLKLFETHSYRDAMALLLITHIVVMAYLIQSYSLAASTYMVIVFVASIYFMMELQRKRYFLKQNNVKWSDLFSVEMMVALPLLVALFVFFPRFTTRFGTGERQVQTIGFSESIELGQMISLSQSTEVAFKVRFLNQKKRDYSSLYFRGAVLTKNKNLSWRKSSKSAEFVQSFAQTQPDYQILLPPRNQRNLFTLDNGEITDVTPRLFLFKKKSENIYYTNNAIEHNVSYSAASTLKLPMEYSDDELLLSEPVSEQVLSLVRSLEADTDENKINGILRHFKDSGFSYSTEVPGYKTIDEFLTTKVGFCEHYASALVILARRMNIPSRVVVGFMGGETNPFDDTLTVRDKFAHAWAEVYLKDKGWTRVDPTAVVYPQRMQNVLITAGTQQRFYENIFTNSLLFFESINNQFELFLMNFNSDSQWNILTRLSDLFKVKTIVVALLVPLFFLILLGIVWWIWKFEADRKDILAQAYSRLLYKVQRYGVKKEIHEGPLEFCERLKKHPNIPIQYAEMIKHYIKLRFARGSNLENIKLFAQKVKRVR